MVSLFDGVKLMLVTRDDYCVPLPLYFDAELANDRQIQFGPFKGSATVGEWALLDAQDEVLDSGPLSRSRHVRRGDRLLFPRGSVKAAAVGDVLGITCVFMPSGFAVGVVPPASTQLPGDALGGTLGDFAYAGQDERVTARPFWLPKRRWAEMPRLLGELGIWQKRLSRPEVGVREQVRRGTAQLVAMGVL